MTQSAQSSQDALLRAYHAMTLLIAANPDLMDFSGWPYAPLVEKHPRQIPAVNNLKNWAEGHIDVTFSLHQAVRDIADHAEWQLAYTEDEVGADFLNRFGYVELVGPTGHFQSQDVRAYLCYWGENLHYPWHLHEAEELYYIVSGRALFEAEGEPAAILGPGDIRVHRPNQPHAMTTTDSPILALLLWRGQGIDGVPRLGHA